MKLEALCKGDKVKIVGYTKGSSAYRKKLLAMGMTPGTIFTVTRIAPLGDPIEILVRNSSLVLRKKEANILLVEKIVCDG